MLYIIYINNHERNRFKRKIRRRNDEEINLQKQD